MRKLPKLEASAATKENPITQRRRLPLEGGEIIPNFLAPNAGFSL
jgi:hypothetical protein